MTAPRILARRIGALLERSMIDVTSEAAAQRCIAAALANDGIAAEAEVWLTSRDRIDFLCGAVGLEVKIRGGSRRDILRQLERYAASDRIAALVLASGGAWPAAINDILGKPLVFANLSRGWL